MNNVINWNSYTNAQKEISTERKSRIEANESISKLIYIDLIKKRIEQKITQKQLANMIGMKQSAIARFEKFESFPRIDTVVRIAHALGLEITAIPQEQNQEEISFDICSEYSYSINETNITLKFNSEGIFAK